MEREAQQSNADAGSSSAIAEPSNSGRWRKSIVTVLFLTSCSSDDPHNWTNLPGDADDASVWSADGSDAAGDPAGDISGDAAAGDDVLVSGWALTFGGEGEDGIGAATATRDGGIVLAAFAGDGPIGGVDFWLVKLDSAGVPVWQAVYGGKHAQDSYGDDFPYALETLADDGLVLAGATWSTGSNYRDGVLVWLQEDGELSAAMHYGGPSLDGFSDVTATPTGLVAVGDTDVTGNRDAWVVAVDGEGAPSWQATYGGSDVDEATGVVRLADGDLLVIGNTRSWGQGSDDVWAIRLAPTGAVVWQRAYGGTARDEATGVALTPDGGVVIVGQTRSFGSGSIDLWLVRLTGAGDVVWQQRFGGMSPDYGTHVAPTPAGGYVVAGHTLSFDSGQNDIWVARVDEDGEAVWHRLFGGAGRDTLQTVVPVPSGLVLPAASDSLSSSFEAWVIGTDADGHAGPLCGAQAQRSITAGQAATTATATVTNAQAVVASLIATTLLLERAPDPPAATVCQ